MNERYLNLIDDFKNETTDRALLIKETYSMLEPSYELIDEIVSYNRDKAKSTMEKLSHARK